MNQQHAREIIAQYLPPDLRKDVLEALHTDELKAYEAMETALQLLTAHILSLRTELLVIKAEVTKEQEPPLSRCQFCGQMHASVLRELCPLKPATYAQSIESGAGQADQPEHEYCSPDNAESIGGTHDH